MMPILTVIRAIIRHPEFTKYHWADSGQVEGLTQLTLAGRVSYSPTRMQVRPPLQWFQLRSM